MTRRADAGARRPSSRARSTSPTTRGARTGSSTARPGAMLVIISGPSGVGKDTIIDAMRRARTTTRSTTTSSPARPGRRAPGEVDGVDYHFLTRERVPAAARRRASFLEANEVHGNWYGSPRDQVREAVVDRPRRDPQDRRPGRPGRQGAGLARRSSSSSSRRRSRRCSRACARGRPRPPTSSSSASATPPSSSPARTTTTTWSSTRPARSSAPPSASTRSSPRSASATRIGASGSRDAS